MPELIKADRRPLFYDVQGQPDGQAMVLIEGLSAHLLGWREEFILPLIEAGYRVVRLDNRDVGLSAKYPDTDYDLADMADDVHELIEHLDIAPAHVVGQSMGGMIAQHLVTRHPEDVASLTLLYTAASVRHLRGEERDIEALERIRRARTRDEAVEIHVQQERLCASRDFSFDEDWKRHLGGLMWDRSHDPEGVVRQRRAFDGRSINLGRLAGVRVPTLLVHGTADNLISHSGSLELHEAIPGSDLWLVQGMGHDLPRELWRDITDRILANASAAAPATVRATGEPL